MRRRVHIIGLAALLCGSCQPLSDLRIDRRPVFITEPIDGSTRGRLLKATGDPQACAAWLTAAGLGFRPVADRTENGFCQVTGAVNLIDAKGEGDAPLLPARPMMACDLAAAVAIWRRQSVEPAARTLFGAEVRQIDRLGVYACRAVGDPVNGRPSAHAHAEAIDIAGVRLSNRRRITVAKDWSMQGAEAVFLRKIRDDACRVFGVTLSPDYNRAHADHLHLEGGRGGLCA